MKRLLGAAGSLMGLLALVTLGIGLIAVLRIQPATRRVSPLASLTTIPVVQSPLGTPTPLRPTLTRLPLFPTQTPSPTFTPSPPTSIPEPLPTLVPGLQTLVYATTKEGRPELYRFQVDRAARKASPAYRIDTRAWPPSRTRIEGLYPSPDGKRVAVAWVYGEGGNYVSILDVNSGQLAPLFGEAAKIDQRVFFLDWSHDGNSLLVLGGIDDRDLKGNAWLVDVNTYSYSGVNIKQTNYDAREITSASYSPDGTAIVYARTTCYQCGSEVWRVAIDRPEQQLLFRTTEFRVEDISWSPDGRYIAFTQWRQTTESHDFAIGELWLMDATGDRKWLLSPAVTGYYKRFGPAWSPNSRQVAFVMNDETTSGKQLGQLHSNIYVADVSSGKISRLTQFSRVLSLAPTWSPGGSILAFASNAGDATGQLELWATWADDQTVRRIDENRSLAADVNASNIAIVWLP